MVDIAPAGGNPLGLFVGAGLTHYKLRKINQMNSALALTRPRRKNPLKKKTFGNQIFRECRSSAAKNLTKIQKKPSKKIFRRLDFLRIPYATSFVFLARISKSLDTRIFAHFPERLLPRNITILKTEGHRSCEWQKI